MKLWHITVYHLCHGHEQSIKFCYLLRSAITFIKLLQIYCCSVDFCGWNPVFSMGIQSMHSGISHEGGTNFTGDSHLSRGLTNRKLLDLNDFYEILLQLPNLKRFFRWLMIFAWWTIKQAKKSYRLIETIFATLWYHMTFRLAKISENVLYVIGFIENDMICLIGSLECRQCRKRPEEGPWAHEGGEGMVWAGAAQ